MAGLIDTIKLAGVLVLAIPAALAGLEFLVVRGEPLIGGALLALAIALVAIKHFLTLPTDVPGLLAGRIGDSVAVEPDDGEE